MKGLNIPQIVAKPTHTSEFAPQPHRELKETDIVIFSKVGASKITPGRDNGLFKAKSTSGFFSKLSAAFKPKAKAQDIYNICRAHGMNADQAATALANIHFTSKQLGLSGYSAAALNKALENHNAL